MKTLRSALFATCLALTLLPTLSAHAQYGGRGGGGRGGRGGGGGGEDQQAEDDAKRKKRDAEFSAGGIALPKVKNAGPCPYVKVLYDAARTIEFKGDDETSASVAYSGEIQKLAAGCEYRGEDPIRIRAQALMAFGRGPRASSGRKTYRYWVAVTDRNRAMLAKEYFDLPVTFPAGKDRVTVTENLAGITIPRNDAKVSGANFEILVGFDITPKMANFNHEGKRFRPNAGQADAKP